MKKGKDLERLITARF